MKPTPTRSASTSAASAPATHSAGVDASVAAFEFVRTLAGDLSKGSLELPSFPEVTLRVQRALNDPSSNVERVVKVVGSDPVLAARIMTVANSAALNPTGKAINDLRAAVSRLGFDALRAAAVSFALAQLRRAESLRGIARELRELWAQNLQVTANCVVLARHSAVVNADTAMLAGVVSGVGKIYILTRAHQFPELFAEPAAYQAIANEWHIGVACALLSHWQMSEEIVGALQESASVATVTRSKANLADLLGTAFLLADLGQQPELCAAAIAENMAAMRLGLNIGNQAELMQAAAAEIAALRAALGS